MTLTLNSEAAGALASQQLKRMLARFLNFQEATGTESEEAASEVVLEGWYSIEGEPHKCCGIIYPLDEEPLVLSEGLTLPTGNLLLDLYLDFATDNPEEEERRFKNFHGSIAHYINNYAGDGYLMTARSSAPPQRTDPRAQAEADPRAFRWFVQYTVKWGPFR
jgi:hypothetical protein